MTRSWQITKHSPILANQIAEVRHNRMTNQYQVHTAAAARVHEPKGRYMISMSQKGMSQDQQ